MMDHVAILSKKLKLLSKVVSGEKTIESRWYKFRKTPFRLISVDDTIYFKESGEPVTVKAKVNKVLFYEHLDKAIFDEIVSDYGPRICIDNSYWQQVNDKNLCTLIFFKDVEQIKPFNIDKTGYGNMCAWMTLESINKIKRTL